MGYSRTEGTVAAAPRRLSHLARTMTVSEIAAAVHGVVAGEGDVPIAGVASVQEAETGDIVFAENPRFLSEAGRSRASAIVACLDAVSPDKPLIRVENPRFAFAQILDMFSPGLAAPIGVHPTAVIGSDVSLPATASIGPNAHIGSGVTLGERVTILAGCSVGDHSRIGDDCVLHPCVVLYAHTILGDRVILHAGAVIGSDGFGFVRLGQRLHKVPHVGNVVIEDDVEIGANTTVDRGKTGSTVIGARTKIDNLVQIAHNVRIGSDTVIASMVGIAGSATIGDGVTIAGQVGIKDHIRVGDGSLLLGQTGAWGDVPAGTVLSGCPGTPHRERLRQEMAIARGPDTVRNVRDLLRARDDMESRLVALEGAVGLLGAPRAAECGGDLGDTADSV